MLKITPAGGLRIGGQTFKPGDKLPEKYARQLEATDRLFDPAGSNPTSPPNYGRYPLPHVMTFKGMVTTLSRAYRYSDEALRHSIENAHMMLNDPAISGPLLARQMMVALLNWSIEPEDSKDPKQRVIATSLTKIIERTPDFTEYRRSLLEAVWYGRFANQNAYGFWVNSKKEKRVVVRQWKPISGDKLVFRYDDGSGEYDANQIGIRVSAALVREDKLAGRYDSEPTGDGMAYFLKPWERNHICLHRHFIRDAEFEDPIGGGMIHGVGLRSFLYWCWYQKQEALSQMTEVIERTGQGFTVYYYPLGNSQAQGEVEEIAREQAHTNVITMPHDAADPDAYRIEQIPANTAGIDALHQIVEDYYGDQILRFILGQTLSSKASATGLGSGVAELHHDSLNHIITYDAVKLQETITKELVRPLLLFNYPAYQNVDFQFTLATKARAPEQDLAAINQLWQMGAEIRVSDLFDLVGMSVPEKDDKTVYNPQVRQAIEQAEAAKNAPPAMPGMPPGMPPGGGPPPGMPPAPGQPDLASMFGPVMNSRAGRPIQYAAEWKEREHPRDDDGKFAEKDTREFHFENHVSRARPAHEMPELDPMKGADQKSIYYIATGQFGASYTLRSKYVDYRWNGKGKDVFDRHVTTLGPNWEKALVNAAKYLAKNHEQGKKSESEFYATKFELNPFSEARARDVFKFGKYAGKAIKEVAEEHPTYIQWLWSQSWFRNSPKHNAFREALEDAGFGAYPETTEYVEADEALNAFLRDPNKDGPPTTPRQIADEADAQARNMQHAKEIYGDELAQHTDAGINKFFNGVRWADEKFNDDSASPAENAYKITLDHALKFVRISMNKDTKLADKQYNIRHQMLDLYERLLAEQSEEKVPDSRGNLTGTLSNEQWHDVRQLRDKADWNEFSPTQLAQAIADAEHKLPPEAMAEVWKSAKSGEKRLAKVRPDAFWHGVRSYCQRVIDHIQANPSSMEGSPSDRFRKAQSAYFEMMKELKAGKKKGPEEEDDFGGEAGDPAPLPPAPPETTPPVAEPEPSGSKRQKTLFWKRLTAAVAQRYSWGPWDESKHPRDAQGQFRSITDMPDGSQIGGYAKEGDYWSHPQKPGAVHFSDLHRQVGQGAIDKALGKTTEAPAKEDHTERLNAMPAGYEIGGFVKQKEGHWQDKQWGVKFPADKLSGRLKPEEAAKLKADHAQQAAAPPATPQPEQQPKQQPKPRPADKPAEPLAEQAISDDTYKAWKESILKTGHLPPQEKNSTVGQAWDKVLSRGYKPDDENAGIFIESMRKAQGRIHDITQQLETHFPAGGRLQPIDPRNTPSPPKRTVDPAQEKQLNDLPAGTKLGDWEKIDWQGLPFMQKGSDLLPPKQWLEKHGATHKQHLDAAASGSQQSAPDDSMATVAAMFGLRPGDVKDPVRAGHFVHLMARNLGHTPTGTKEQQLASSAEFLAGQHDKLNSIVNLAKQFGFSGQAQHLVERSRNAARHLITTAERSGYQPGGLSPEDDLMGALHHLHDRTKQPVDAEVVEPEGNIFQQLLKGMKGITWRHVAGAVAGMAFGNAIRRNNRQTRFAKSEPWRPPQPGTAEAIFTDVYRFHLDAEGNAWHYARKPKAQQGQMNLFDQATKPQGGQQQHLWEEKKHPRDAAGEFAPKGSTTPAAPATPPPASTAPAPVPAATQPTEPSKPAEPQTTKPDASDRWEAMEQNWLGKHPGELSAADFHSDSELSKKWFAAADRTRQAHNRNYFMPYPDVKPGDWKRDDMKLMYGNFIQQLREFDPHELVLSESDYTKEGPGNNPEGRKWDAEKYADWIKEGSAAPPIQALQMPDGRFKVVDGHRRVAAAKMAGAPIRAWVQYYAPTDSREAAGNTRAGKFIETPLTDQIAAAHHEYLRSKSPAQPPAAPPQTAPATPNAPKDLFGNPIEQKKTHARGDFDSLGGQQQTLFGGLDALPNQMNLFAEPGVPDDLLPAHLRGKSAEHYARLKSMQGQMNLFDDAKPLGGGPQQHLWREEQHPRDQLGEFTVKGSATPTAQPEPEPEPELSPEDDWKTNGVRAKKFKEWFGDWENDPENASKVIDQETGEPQETHSIGGEGSKTIKDGKPIVMYHGTPKGGFDRFDPEKLKRADDLLYGAGFYFTEDPTIATEYAQGEVSPLDAKLIESLNNGSQFFNTRKDALRFIEKNKDALKRNANYDTRRLSSIEFHPLKYADRWAISQTGYAKPDEIFAFSRDLELADMPAIEKYLEGLLFAGMPPDDDEFYTSMLNEAKKASSEKTSPMAKAYAVMHIGNFILDPKRTLPYPEDRDIKIAQGMAKAAGITINNLMEPPNEVKSVYLNIRKPLDVDNDKISTSALMNHDSLGATFRNGLRRRQQEAYDAQRSIALDLQAAKELNVDRVIENLKSVTHDPRWGKVNETIMTREYQQQQKDEKISRLEDRLKVVNDRIRGLESDEISYDDAVAIVGKQWLNPMLQDIGYDGITHIGGRMVGNRDHRVWIAFRPNQIKSTSNSGQFDSNDDRIQYKRNKSG